MARGTHTTHINLHCIFKLVAWLKSQQPIYITISPVSPQQISEQLAYVLCAY
jgi:hypothetical protein